MMAPAMNRFDRAEGRSSRVIASCEKELTEKISAGAQREPEINHYPAGHALLNEEDLLGTYDAEQAKIARNRIVAFLRAHLG